ncbi:MAG: PIG-L family deacetylase [Leeuwenhoekiella sp.]
MIHKLFLAVAILGLFVSGSYAQQPDKPSASEIYEQFENLNFLGSALYIAAHPDDENTTLISYLANAVNARTAYLSLTRGDGGQNLVGPEIRELLGVIRTQELLAARRTDGGQQRFTRANDFGYSKHPDETLQIWEQDEVLSDVVWAIRTFKPDIVINRFDHRSPGSTHGHHTSSAMLSVEAFDLVGDASKFPEQLKFTETWQPKRLFFNTSWWFYGGREAFENADKSNLVSVDVGSYYPNHGLSNTEISALSRSQHKSQGFGNTGSRGSQTEYLELLQGNMPKKDDLFEGIDTSWKRLKGGAEIGNILMIAQQDYDFNNPSASVSALVKAYRLVQNLEDDHWKEIKSQQLLDLIKACSGLYIEAQTQTQTATTDQDIEVTIEAINRSSLPLVLTGITINPTLGKTEEICRKVEVLQRLNDNLGFSQTFSFNTGEAGLSTAYWLKEIGSLGMYKVEEQTMIGKPETGAPFTATFQIEMDGVSLPFKTDLIYKYNDRVDGEVYEPFEIVPPVSAEVIEPVLIFADASAKSVAVHVKSFRESITGTLHLDLPVGWNASPKNASVSLPEKGMEKTVTFEVTPPAGASKGKLQPVFSLDGKEYNTKVVKIDYDHIPLQTLTLPSVNEVVRLDIQKRGDYIGYIAGAGDVVPESLEQIGYQVANIDPAMISEDLLQQFDAVVVGIRAYNTVDEMRNKQPVLMNYVKNGGTVVVQYNTSRGGYLENLGPYPLTLSRDRVTDENAEVTIIKPDAELMNYPNKITNDDFDGWVQERGLYFPDAWDERYTPLFSIRDIGEKDSTQGSLLYTTYGKGHFIYTGLSFFRELPAGVPGAYRLFANMLSVGKNDQNIKN